MVVSGGSRIKNCVCVFFFNRRNYSMYCIVKGKSRRERQFEESRERRENC